MVPFAVVVFTLLAAVVHGQTSNAGLAHQAFNQTFDPNSPLAHHAPAAEQTERAVTSVSGTHWHLLHETGPPGPFNVTLVQPSNGPLVSMRVTPQWRVGRLKVAAALLSGGAYSADDVYLYDEVDPADPLDNYKTLHDSGIGAGATVRVVLARPVVREGAQRDAVCDADHVTCAIYTNADGVSVLAHHVPKRYMAMEGI